VFSLQSLGQNLKFCDFESAKQKNFFQKRYRLFEKANIRHPQSADASAAVAVLRKRLRGQRPLVS
jgi:hypothetical protein